MAFCRVADKKLEVKRLYWGLANMISKKKEKQEENVFFQDINFFFIGLENIIYFLNFKLL